MKPHTNWMRFVLKKLLALLASTVAMNAHALDCRDKEAIRKAPGAQQMRIDEIFIGKWDAEFLLDDGTSTGTSRWSFNSRECSGGACIYGSTLHSDGATGSINGTVEVGAIRGKWVHGNEFGNPPLPFGGEIYIFVIDEFTSEGCWYEDNKANFGWINFYRDPNNVDVLSPIVIEYKEFLKSTNRDVQQRSVSLASYHSGLIGMVGSRGELACTIKRYQNDPFYSETIIQDLLTIFRNAHGDVNLDSFDCNRVDRADVSEVAEQCSDSNESSPVCLMYRSYVREREWFTTAQSRVQSYLPNIINDELRAQFERLQGILSKGLGNSEVRQ